MCTREAIEDRLRAAVADTVRRDPQAPCYHLISPNPNVCFDPNGALCWQGRYHLFYIFQDPALRLGPEFWQHGHCWGHASSADLVHWTHHPTALAPAPGDPDLRPYSGCALLDARGTPTLVYHGYGAGTCLATPLDDDLIRWQKSPRNPVIPEPKPGDPARDVYNVFDPHVWREGDTYHAILGGMAKPGDLGDTAYHFTSTNLLEWEYRGPFYAPNPAWTDTHEDCACPDFFPLGDRHALLCISHCRGTRCYLGDYRDGRFVPTAHHRLNWPGGASHAPESLRDDRGRRLYWAWAINQQQAPGGAPGVMTLPRVLSLDQRGRLCVEPPDELARLRRDGRQLTAFTVLPGDERLLPDIAGDCLELAITAEVAPGGRFGVQVRRGPGKAEVTEIVYDAAAGALAIDTTNSSLDMNVFRPSPIWDPKGDPSHDVAVQSAPFALDPGEPLRLRLFLDRSMLEVFANGRCCLTQRIYPVRPDSTGIACVAGGGPARVRGVDAWRMAAVNAGE